MWDWRYVTWLPSLQAFARNTMGLKTPRWHASGLWRSNVRRTAHLGKISNSRKMTNETISYFSREYKIILIKVRIRKSCSRNRYPDKPSTPRLSIIKLQEQFAYCRALDDDADGIGAWDDDGGGTGGGDTDGWTFSGSQSSPGDGIREITLTRLWRKPQRRNFRGSIAIRQERAIMEISPFK